MKVLYAVSRNSGPRPVGIGELLENIKLDSDVIRFVLSWNHSSDCIEEIMKLEAMKLSQ